MTKPYTNCWQTSRISPNLEFFYVRNSFYYFQICPTLVLFLPNVQVPIVYGQQNHVPTLGKLQEEAQILNFSILEIHSTTIKFVQYVLSLVLKFPKIWYMALMALIKFDSCYINF